VLLSLEGVNQYSGSLVAEVRSLYPDLDPKPDLGMDLDLAPNLTLSCIKVKSFQHVSTSRCRFSSLKCARYVYII
jgi:hypothetical protein